nr:hypothetical protein [Tanacetum cinerariifolium]
MALPPRDQRHQYLRFKGLQYSDTDIVDFEERLGKIYDREVAAAGAPEAAEDALVVDEGALAVPVPIKAPQPPHPIVGPTRTMA